MAANENLKNFYILLLDLKEPKQIAYFTQHLKVSTKTIYNYLKELEYELRPFDLHVEKRRGEGYLLVGAEDERDIVSFGLFTLVLTFSTAVKTACKILEGVISIFRI